MLKQAHGCLSESSSRVTSCSPRRREGRKGGATSSAGDRCRSQGSCEGEAATGEPRKPVLHDCRQTFGAMLVAEGRDVHTVKRMMGHANVGTRSTSTAASSTSRAAPTRTLAADYGNLLETAR